MKLRIEVLVGCGLAILTSLVMASVIAAHAHLTEGAAPRHTTVTDVAGEAATPTAAPPEAATSVPAPEGVGSPMPRQQVLPVPEEAAPATSARAVQ